MCIRDRDWSGSMSEQLHSTYKQLLNLTAFCKKVQIPFEVYAFTNEWRVVDMIKNNDPNSKAYPFRIYKVQSNEATCC